MVALEFWDCPTENQTLRKQRQTAIWSAHWIQNLGRTRRTGRVCLLCSWGVMHIWHILGAQKWHILCLGCWSSKLWHNWNRSFKFYDFNLKLELNLNCTLLCKTFCTIEAKICITTVILFLMKTTGQRFTYQLSEKLYQRRPTHKHR